MSRPPRARAVDLVQLPQHLHAQRFAWLLQPFGIAIECVRHDVLVDGIEQELPSGLRCDDERIRLDLPCPVCAEVLLHVRPFVVRVTRVGEVLATARSQAVDPRQAVRIDEVTIQAEAVDDQPLRVPEDAVRLQSRVHI